MNNLDTMWFYQWIKSMPIINFCDMLINIDDISLPLCFSDYWSTYSGGRFVCFRLHPSSHSVEISASTTVKMNMFSANSKTSCESGNVAANPGVITHERDIGHRFENYTEALDNANVGEQKYYKKAPSRSNFHENVSFLQALPQTQRKTSNYSKINTPKVIEVTECSELNGALLEIVKTRAEFYEYFEDVIYPTGEYFELFLQCLLFMFVGYGKMKCVFSMCSQLNCANLEIKLMRSRPGL